jgi:hypothetical protein
VAWLRYVSGRVLPCSQRGSLVGYFGWCIRVSVRASRFSWDALDGGSVFPKSRDHGHRLPVSGQKPPWCGASTAPTQILRKRARNRWVKPRLRFVRSKMRDRNHRRPGWGGGGPTRASDQPLEGKATSCWDEMPRPRFCTEWDIPSSVQHPSRLRGHPERTKLPSHRTGSHFASFLLQAGVDVYCFRRMLGHADISLTVNTLWVVASPEPTGSTRRAGLRCSIGGGRRTMNVAAVYRPPCLYF